MQNAMHQPIYYSHFLDAVPTWRLVHWSIHSAVMIAMGRPPSIACEWHSAIESNVTGHLQGVLACLAGRLLLDTYVCSRDLLREVEYSLANLAGKLLNQQRMEIHPQQVRFA